MPQHEEKLMTLEQIEAHVKSANLEQFDKPQAAAAAGAQQDITSQLQKVCSVYRGVRPILQVVAGFPLLPGSIKGAVNSFMSVMNTICP